MLSELNKVMIKKLALNLTYRELTVHFLYMKELKEGDMSTLDFIHKRDVLLRGFETGELDIHDFVKEEYMNKLVKEHEKNLSSYYEDSPEKVKEMFSAYTDYLAEKYPTMS